MQGLYLKKVNKLRAKVKFINSSDPGIKLYPKCYFSIYWSKELFFFCIFWKAAVVERDRRQWWRMKVRPADLLGIKLETDY